MFEIIFIIIMLPTSFGILQIAIIFFMSVQKIQTLQKLVTADI